MNVLINGLGNIGTTLANVLLDYKDLLGIDDVMVHKNTSTPWNARDADFLKAYGAKIVKIDDVLDETDFLFECRSHADDIEDLISQAPKLLGVCTQGGEGTFGVPFMSGANNNAVALQKRAHVVSCNTHGIASLLQLFGGQTLENIISADAVVVRRSDDIANNEKLVGANVVVRHCDETFGTHHGADLQSLFATVGINCTVTTSDITTPSQLMHAVRFSFELKDPSIIDEIAPTNTVAFTKKFDSNKIFDLGRRYGNQGRIFVQSILVTPSLLVHGNTVKGWAFVPQEGNTILSTIHAFLLQTGANDIDKTIATLQNGLIQKYW